MIVVIDYGMGNLGSVVNMLKKIKADVMISSVKADIDRADKLILPGVGAFDNGIKNLQERGFIDLLNKKVLQQGTPILGLCLGMQLFSLRSEEGTLPGLSWLVADTIRFRVEHTEPRLKIPHMGWNYVQIKQPNPVFKGLEQEARFYFVHSYHLVCRDKADVLATTEYGYEFASAVVKDNIVGTQFHPEKSHRFGMQLFKNFVEGF